MAKSGFRRIFEVFQRPRPFLISPELVRRRRFVLSYRLDEIYPSAPSVSPNLNVIFPKIPPSNSSPNFVERPIPYCLDLDIYCLSNLWDPSRVVRIDLLCRHFTLVF